MKGTSCCAISYKEKLEPSDRACYGKFLSHCLHDFHCLYLRVTSLSLTTLAIISYNLPCVSALFWPISIARYVFKSPGICFCDAGLVSDKNCLQVKYSG